MKTIPYNTAQSFFLMFAASKQGIDERFEEVLQSYLDSADLTWEDLDMVVLRAKPVEPLTGELPYDVPLDRLLPIFQAFGGRGSIERAFALAGIPLPADDCVAIMKAACKQTELN
jgi:hypothetical protein